MISQEIDDDDEGCIFEFPSIKWLMRVQFYSTETMIPNLVSNASNMTVNCQIYGVQCVYVVQMILNSDLYFERKKNWFT